MHQRQIGRSSNHLHQPWSPVSLWPVAVALTFCNKTTLTRANPRTRSRSKRYRRLRLRSRMFRKSFGSSSIPYSPVSDRGYNFIREAPKRKLRDPPVVPAAQKTEVLSGIAEKQLGNALDSKNELEPISQLANNGRQRTDVAPLFDLRSPAKTGVAPLMKDTQVMYTMRLCS